MSTVNMRKATLSDALMLEYLGVTLGCWQSFLKTDDVHGMQNRMPLQRNASC